MTIRQQEQLRLGKVLIVAKCIVNEIERRVKEALEQVLIVAKCIVNIYKKWWFILLVIVLIVAKCIVNVEQFNEIKELRRY